MLFFWVYGFSVFLMAVLSVTSVVDHRRLWWQAAWALAGATFAINQFCLYVNWDVNREVKAEVIDLLLTLVTPITVLLLATLNPRRGPRLGPAARAFVCVTAGIGALGVWLPALLMTQCVLSSDCL